MLKDYDHALNFVRARSELVQVRREVQRAEKEADSPLAYLPQPPKQDTRPAPNGMLRSALFAAIGKHPRQRFTGKTLPSLKRIEVKFKGEQLDQMDLDLWLVLLHLCRRTPLGFENRLSSYVLLKALDLSDNGRTREDLKASMLRLRSCAVELQQGVERFNGSLVDSAERAENGECWCIRLSPELTKLHGEGWTAVHWPVRRSLRGKPLAQWLHGYFSSHIKAHAISARLLRDLSGSTAELRSFSTSLKRALTAVKTASTAHGQFFDWSIKGGLIDVRTKPDHHLERV
jgi:hypothetical protein